MSSRNLTNRYFELRQSSRLLNTGSLGLDDHENKSSDGLLNV